MLLKRFITEKTTGRRLSGSGTSSSLSTTLWQCPLESHSTGGKIKQCSCSIDLGDIALQCIGPHRTEELRKMEFGKLFDAAIESHLREHLQSIGLTMENNVS
jgi:hypothetical protein